MPAGSSTKQNSKITTIFKPKQQPKPKHPVLNNTMDTEKLSGIVSFSQFSNFPFKFSENFPNLYKDTPSTSGGLLGGLMKRGTDLMTNILYEKVSFQSKKARIDETRPEIATIIIEIHRMPALMVEMDKRRTILDLKVRSFTLHWCNTDFF